MYDNRTYHNGFLAFAHQEALSINYQETQKNTITWQGDITENNVLVIAAIFNPTANIGYSLPPNQYPFKAYYVDGAAAAHPGETGSNTRNGSITHTVFIEEATATWCKNCPSVADSLYNISQSPQQPFYYAALIEDKNNIAQNRLKDDYNILGYPTLYYDGGKQVLLGGNHGDEVVESLIKNCSESDVHDLDLNLTVTWQGNGELKIDYSITNLEETLPSQFNIKNVFGGIKKITAIIENMGNSTANNVEWQVIISGGILDRINSITNGTLQNVPAGRTRIIRSKGGILQPVGFGKVDIIIKVGTTLETIQGFIIGNIIKIQQSDPPEYKVHRIRGGIKKIKAVIKNIGDTDGTNVDWHILITGGILNRIHSLSSGTIRRFPDHCKRIIRSKGELLQPRGFGGIDIKITIGPQEIMYKGFIVGRYIKVFKLKR
jgi:thiol-disulfide isomerase/thioredoxin